MRKLPVRLLTSLLLLCLVAFAATSRQASQAAAMKFDRIGSEKLKPGETVTLNEDELNSYLTYDYGSEIPEGIRNLNVKIIKDNGIAEALVDLEKLPAVKQSAVAALAAKIFSGEKKLKAQCRFVSAAGKGKVDIESVELDGQVLPDFLVQLLIASAIQPEFPDFKPGEPFPLSNNLKQVRLEPARIIFISN